MLQTTLSLQTISTAYLRKIAGKLLKKFLRLRRPSVLSWQTKKKQKKKTLFLSPTTAEEIEDVIKTFNLNKAIGPNSIPVTILKKIRK